MLSHADEIKPLEPLAYFLRFSPAKAHVCSY
jgi:hypothetical protein